MNIHNSQPRHDDGDDDDRDSQPAELFPPPPPFYRLFTSENVTRNAAIQAEASAQRASDDDAMAVDVTEVQRDDGKASTSKDGHELSDIFKFFQPPEIPQDEKFQCFGSNFNLHENLLPLSDLGIEQLYPSPPATEPGNEDGQSAEWSIAQLNNLRNIIKSIMIRYIELADTLATNPGQFSDQITSLTTLFLNAHHIINEYRPHQARESVIGMLSRRIDRCETEIADVHRARATVATIFSAISKPDFVIQSAQKQQQQQQQIPKGQTGQTPGRGLNTPALPSSSTPAFFNRSFADLSSALPSSAVQPHFQSQPSPTAPTGPPAAKPDLWASLQEGMLHSED